jgi:hypothetical protein
MCYALLELLWQARQYKVVAIFTMARPTLFSVTLFGSALVLAILAPTEFAQARPSLPPSSSNPAPPQTPTTPVGPRPSASGVAKNSGAFVATVQPKISSSSVVQPTTGSKVSTNP